MKLRPGVLLLLLAVVASRSTASTSETHCVAGEEVFFSCPMEGSNKTASLCGGIDESGVPLWLQYRFGPIGSAELVFPAERAGSLQQFGGVDQSAKAIGLTLLEVWFRVDGRDYLIEHQSGGDCDGECVEASNLVVFEHGQAVSRFACAAPVVNALFWLYGHISDDPSRRP